MSNEHTQQLYITCQSNVTIYEYISAQLTDRWSPYDALGGAAALLINSLELLHLPVTSFDQFVRVAAPSCHLI